jgi:hypothetical protein
MSAACSVRCTASFMRPVPSPLPLPPNAHRETRQLSSTILPRRGRSRRRFGPAPGATALAAWPLPNLWLGVSVEDQERMARILDLLQTPAAIRWVCFEPLLDRVAPEAVPVGDRFFDALTGSHYTVDGRGRTVPVEGPPWRPLDWVVAGGEIGARARLMHPCWLAGQPARPMRGSAGPFLLQAMGRVGSGVAAEIGAKDDPRPQTGRGTAPRRPHLGGNAASGAARVGHTVLRRNGAPCMIGAGGSGLKICILRVRWTDRAGGKLRHLPQLLVFLCFAVR